MEQRLAVTPGVAVGGTAGPCGVDEKKQFAVLHAALEKNGAHSRAWVIAGFAE